jgi:hypothetical protein
VMATWAYKLMLDTHKSSSTIFDASIVRDGFQFFCDIGCDMNERNLIGQ